MSKKFVYHSELIEKEWLNDSYFTLRFFCPEIAQICLPGQFVNLKMSDLYDPLLRRPMSIYKCNRQEGWIEFLLKVVGKGTLGFSTVKKGEFFGLFGPLGNGFNSNEIKSAILIGGGIGIAPLVFLAEELAGNGISINFIQGFRSKNEYCCGDEIMPFVNQLLISTDDGSFGIQGDVAQVLNKLIAENSSLKNSTLLACGPNQMMKSIEKICLSQNIKAQFSVETHMACGFGVCVGCPMPKSDGSGYYLSCIDGPVFNLGEIKFE